LELEEMALLLFVLSVLFIEVSKMPLLSKELLEAVRLFCEIVLFLEA